MRPVRETIPMADALARVMGAAVPIERTERVGLAGANGRVLAAAVHAPADVPPFDRAAMDGYAVVASDTAGASRQDPVVLRQIGSVHTGEMPAGPVARGTCMAIATGAPVPDGADAVVMVEETAAAGDNVQILAPARPRQNVGPRGSDLTAGQAVLEAGAFLNPARVGALAAAGCDSVEVYARPVVAVVSTGNEVVEPGRPLGPGQIYDVNRQTLSAVVAMHGGAAVLLPLAADDLDGLSAALRRAVAEADVVVFSGGSSAGDRDLVVDALRDAGRVLFHGIAVKPGKPTAFGHVASRPVLAMPGNPTSCLSNAYLLLVPLLRRIARLPAHRPETIRAPLARRIASTPDRHQFYTVRIEDGRAVPAFKSSGDITSMSRADGYIEIPAQVESVEAGEEVEVKLF